MTKFPTNFLRGNSDMTEIDLSGVENWREYDFNGRVYRIDAPQSVMFRSGGSTHRVKDSLGIWHLVPAPGFNGCVIRFDGTVVA